MRTEVFLPPPSHSRFRFPGPTDRVTVNGMTGSGKSTFALWLVAESADFDRKPWIILDFKGEKIVREAQERDLFQTLSIDAHIPKHPGVYVVNHNPRLGQGPVADFLWRIYERGHVGVFLDEATMVPELRGEANSGGPFQSLLSQGRSKGIPVYTLAQRPVNVNRMVFTENNFLSCFRLRSKEDLKKVVGEIPEDSANYARVWGANVRVPQYWSRWYDANADVSFLLRPAPDAKETLEIFAHRLDRIKKHRVV